MMLTEAEKIANAARKVRRQALKEIYAKADAKAKPDGTFFGWYGIICSSAAECRVGLKLKTYAEMLGMGDLVDHYLIPNQLELVRNSDGSERWKSERLFAGYLLCKLKLTPDLKNLICAIPGVVGFVTDRTGMKPQLVSQREVDCAISLMYQSVTGQMKKKQRTDLVVDQWVVIKGGPFENFKGQIKRIADGRLMVQLSLFGRITTVSFDQSIIAPDPLAGKV